MIIRWACLAAVVFSFVAVGCGEPVPQPPKLDLVPVSGTVKFGGQPTAGIRVTFVPTGETKGLGAFATTDESGKYILTHTGEEKPGIPAGTYTVKFLKTAGTGLKESGGLRIHPDLAGENQIPPAWRGDPDQHGSVSANNRVTVPPSGGTFDFDIPAQ